VVAFHLKSSTGIDFDRPETVTGSIGALEDYLQRTFRDGAGPLMDRAGRALQDAFSISGGDFSYGQAGDLLELVDKLSRRSSALAVLSRAKDGDHFALSYAGTGRRRDAADPEFPGVLFATFLQRGLQKRCLNVLIISEEERRQLRAFLDRRRGQYPPAIVNLDGVVIATHEELYGSNSLAASAPLSFQPILDTLNSAKQRAADSRLSGLNVSGTVAGALFGNARFAQCIQLEKMWHETARHFSMPMTVMCPYDKVIEDPHRSALAGCHDGGVHQIQ
jgi:hypothetical protein